jgi:hypothetical protein
LANSSKQASIISIKYKPYIGVFLYLAFLVGIFYVGDVCYDMIQKQDADIKTNKTEIAYQKQVIEDIRYMKRLTPDFPEKVSVLDNLIFETNDVGASQFLAQIESISKKSKVSIFSIKPTLEGGRISAELQVMGSKAAVKDFLKNLENNKLIINVNNISITYGESGDASATIGLVTGG